MSANLPTRSQQLEYFLQGSVEESSISSLRHRLKGLCDPSTTHNKFADHEIVYGLRPGTFCETCFTRTEFGHVVNYGFLKCLLYLRIVH